MNTLKINNIMSNKVFTILAAVLLTASVLAQSPEKMSYQAVVRDASNNLVTNQSVGMQISILQGSASGTAVYVETQTSSTNANGLVNIEIGGGTVVSGNFSTIDWANDTYFIKTETDPAGGTSYTITGTSQLLSVPYALYAKTAENMIGVINETDPVFLTSVAKGITEADTVSWNNKLDSYSETDPLFNSSIASSITSEDTAAWNAASIGSYNEIDPVFDTSVAAGITETDTIKWNNKIDTITGTEAAFNGWDKDAADDFSSDYNDLTNKPGIIDSINTYVDGSETKLIEGTNVSITGNGTFGDPYVVNAVGTDHYVGELYGGGIVFWVSPDGQHGLIASLDDLDGGSGVAWSNVTGTSVGSSARSMTDGANNTAAIIAQGGHTNSAAKLCDDYTGGDSTDWYLPSGRELYLLASQDVIIDYILDNDGDAGTKGFLQEYNPSIYGRYWSSTEAFNTDSFYYSFTSGYSTSGTKSALFRVRAVRAF